MKNIIIFGATSTIAQAFSRLYAPQKASFFLVARNAERLDSIKKDLLIRGSSAVHIAVSDLNIIDNHRALIEEGLMKMGSIDIALIAQGTLSNQRDCETTVQTTLDEIKTNFSSPVSLLTLLGGVMESQNQGNIAVMGSVAGDRGRQSNYVYGSAKGGLAIFVQGLRHRLSVKKINVTLIKPGFVDTPMTAHLKKGGLLWSKPERVARDIDRAMRKGKSTCYTPWFWRWIMFIILCIPDWIFRRIRL
jgi:decaprenylphospho-beta-D-erythro-pentofuranosid-2-ulose 2-reductase